MQKVYNRTEFPIYIGINRLSMTQVCNARRVPYIHRDKPAVGIFVQVVVNEFPIYIGINSLLFW